MSKLPKLLSVRQAAALTGLSVQSLRYALRMGRIASKYAQKVDGRWILSEDFKILRSGMNKDPLLASLPEEFISEEVAKDWNVDLPEHKRKLNFNPVGDTRKVNLPGYDRETEGYTMWELYFLTHVHPNTQRHIKSGEQVQAKVALRLARGLGIPVERLLR